jgi:hypothetical protein
MASTKRKIIDKTTDAKKKNITVTPEKTKDPIIIWYYRLQDGSSIVCNDIAEVMLYQEEYDNVIQDRFTFTSQADYDKFLLEEEETKKNNQQKKKEEQQNNKKPKLDTIAQEKAKALAKKVIQYRERNKPKNRLELYYRAVPMSTKAIVVVHYMNMRSQHLFYAKPKNLHENTKSFITELNSDEINIPNDNVVRNMILNMTHYRMRNPDSGPDSVMKTYGKTNNDNNNNNNNNSRKSYDEEVTVTELDMPNTIIKSLEDEDTYIREKLLIFGKTLLTIQGSDAFKEVLLDQLTEKITKWMYGDNHTNVRFTFQQWCDSADIHIERIQNLNTYITLEDAKDIKIKMANHRCTPRYRNVTNDVTNDEKLNNALH